MTLADSCNQGEGKQIHPITALLAHYLLLR